MDSPLSLGPDNLVQPVVAAPPRKRWRAVTRFVPSEAVKYAIVGVSGIGVNLAVMAAILHQTSVRDWRASLGASLVSTMSNYVWNNFWTFRARAHSGLTFVRRYVLYLTVSLLGLVVTTIVYSVSSRELASTEIMAVLPVSALLLCQLLAILVGTTFNYILNRTITWPHPGR